VNEAEGLKERRSDSVFARNRIHLEYDSCMMMGGELGVSTAMSISRPLSILIILPLFPVFTILIPVLHLRSERSIFSTIALLRHC
jgi:hypothetical protein